MLDFVPPQAWIVFFLAMLALNPAAYIGRYVQRATSVRDITQPPEDGNWRTDRQLHRSVALLTGLLAVGIFIFTPFAERFARSDAFVPSLLGAIGSFALGTVVKGWRDGHIEPLLRGFSRRFDRKEQPLAYWASFGWNTILGCLFLAGSIFTVHDKVTPRCDDGEDKRAWVEAVKTCDTMLAASDVDSERRAELLAARGRVHDRLGNDQRALADYAGALKLDPQDSYTLYNRGRVYSRMREQQRAIADFDASLKLRPDNDDAYLWRGITHLDSGRFEAAIGDFTTLHARDPKHPHALANRGIAYAWLNKPEFAERDFASVSAKGPAWPVALRGRAILATRRKDHDAVIAYLSEALRLDPDDIFAMRMRANAYHETGELTLSRDDNYRANRLNAKASSSQTP